MRFDPTPIFERTELSQREQIVLLLKTGSPKTCICNPYGLCGRHMTDRGVPQVVLMQGVK